MVSGWKSSAASIPARWWAGTKISIWKDTALPVLWVTNYPGMLPMHSTLLFLPIIVEESGPTVVQQGFPMLTPGLLRALQDWQAGLMCVVSVSRERLELH